MIILPFSESLGFLNEALAVVLNIALPIDIVGEGDLYYVREDAKEN